ncbi:MAG: nonstructural protein [Arizlama microvirus]|nr:MAG: nonstructural protein [Arizlama microvirus]
MKVEMFSDQSKSDHVYSVFDTIAKKYGPLFHAINDLVAVRYYKKIISSVPGYEKEYNLYHIGSFNDDTGIFTALDKPNYVYVKEDE